MPLIGFGRSFLTNKYCYNCEKLTCLLIYEDYNVNLFYRTLESITFRRIFDSLKIWANNVKLLVRIYLKTAEEKNKENDKRHQEIWCECKTSRWSVAIFRERPCLEVEIDSNIKLTLELMNFTSSRIRHHLKLVWYYITVLWPIYTVNHMAVTQYCKSWSSQLSR